MNQPRVKLPSVKIALRDGRLHIVGLGAWYSYWREPYHLLLTISWPGFLLLTAFGYLGTNALFALIYLAGGDGIANARPGNFLDAFFFSVQTMASIGYGAMYPNTAYTNTVVTIEALIGLLGVALGTGLAFARFSRPTARVIFSRVAVVTPYNGVPTLMFRTANQRRNQILEAQLRVYLMRDEVSTEGQWMRRFYDLKLLRSQTPSFSLTWTAMHPIDEESPLYGETLDSLTESQTMILVSMSGIDETVVQTIHTRHTYIPQELLWNQSFVDILVITPAGHRYINYKHFHDTKPLEPLELDV